MRPPADATRAPATDDRDGAPTAPHRQAGRRTVSVYPARCSFGQPSANRAPQAPSPQSFVPARGICFDCHAMPEPTDAASPTTIIRHAASPVAWDEVAGTHVHRRDADLAFPGDTITAT